MIRDANLSDDGIYRWWLTRRWADGPRVLVWAMLNPSTADAEVDDPTIRRCIRFSQREGYDGLSVVNLFAYRATKPAELFTAEDPVGFWNEAAIQFELARAGGLVCAWGAAASKIGSRLTVDIPVWARDHGVPVWCLGRTKAGWPRHPLYVPADQPFEEYR